MTVYGCPTCDRFISGTVGNPVALADPVRWSQTSWTCPVCESRYCDWCVPPAQQVCPICPLPARAPAFGRTKGDAPKDMLDSVAARVQDIARVPVRKYASFDYGIQQDPNARSFLLIQQNASWLSTRLRETLPDGFVVFMGATRWPGEGQAENQCELVVARAASQPDILRLSRTAAPADGLKTEDLIARLQRYDKLYGINIVHAESDRLVFKLRKMPNSPKVFCMDLKEICPGMFADAKALDEFAEGITATRGVVGLRWNGGAPLEAVARGIARHSGAPLRAYSTFDFGRARDANARSFLIAEKQAVPRVNTIRETLLPPGFIAFVGTTRWLGEETHEGEAEIVIARGESQFECIRVARTDPVNHDLDAEAVIAKLEQYDKNCVIEIFSAETDSVEFQLRNWPAPMEDFCADVMAFCPDLREFFASAAEYGAALKETNGFVSLWWD